MYTRPTIKPKFATCHVQGCKDAIQYWESFNTPHTAKIANRLKNRLPLLIKLEAQNELLKSNGVAVVEIPVIQLITNI